MTNEVLDMTCPKVQQELLDYSKELLDEVIQHKPIVDKEKEIYKISKRKKKVA